MAQIASLRSRAMACCRSLLSQSVKAGNASNTTQVRSASNKMVIRPSRFQWERAKDDMYYFLTLGAVPVVLIITYNNVRHGPAELRDIPEGYVPEVHEYYRCPTQRMFAKYFPYPSYEKTYERHLYYLNKDWERQQAVKLMSRTKELSKKSRESKVWYMVPSQAESKLDFNKEWQNKGPQVD